MMKLEVGMYIRTDDGKIGQVTAIGKRHYVYANILSIKDWPIPTYSITRASHSIIDLIEDKDFCEIEFYSPRYDKRVTRIFQVDYIVEDNICFENGHCQLNILHAEWSNQNKKLNPIIKRVLTHEQFEREAHKV